jgi:O-antigen/teichoic acid export membrane protein
LSVLRQSAIIFGLGWLLAPLQFVTAILVARALGPHGKGILAVLTAITAVMTSIAGLGIAAGAAFLYKQPEHDRPAVLGSAAAIVLGSSAAVVAGALAGGDAFVGLFVGGGDQRTMDRAWVVLALVAVVPAAIFTLGDLVLVLENEMRVYALRTAGTGLIALGLTWLLLFGLDAGLTGVLASQPAAALFGVGVLGVWLRSHAGLRPLRVSASAVRALLGVGLQQYAIDLIALVAKRVDVFLIASLLSLEDAGIYAAAILVPQVLTTLPRAAMWPLVGSLSRDGATDAALLARASRVQILALALGSSALAASAPLLVPALFGARFAAAVAPFRWALIGIVAAPVTVVVNAYLTSRGRPGRTVVSAAFGTGVQVVLLLALLRVWGTSGAAIALSANYLTTAALQLLILRREQPIGVGELLLAGPGDVREAWRQLRRRRSPA